MQAERNCLFDVDIHLDSHERGQTEVVGKLWAVGVGEVEEWENCVLIDHTGTAEALKHQT